MRITIAGGYDTHNMGDHMGLLGLARALPKASWTLLTRHPGHYTSINATHVRNLDHASRDESKGRYLYGFNAGDDPKRLEDVKAAISSADLLLLGGGRLFIDQCHGVMRGPIPYYLELAKIARWVGTPVWLVNNTYVPIQNDHARGQVRLLRSLAQEDLTREPDPQGTHAPDTAYALSEAPHQDREGKNLGIAICSQCGDPQRAFIQAIIDHYRPRRLTFITQQSYVVDDPFSFCDFSAARSMRSKLDFDGDVELHPLVGVDRLREIYGSCSLAVSSRRHGMVMAACQGTPVIGLPLERNTSNVVYDLGLPHLPGECKNYSTELLVKDAIGGSGAVLKKCRERWIKSKAAYSAALERSKWI